MRNRIGRPRFMQSFASAGGGPFLATPPTDGETYGVRNGDTWIEVCEEAPKNGTLYGRISNAWQPIPSGGDPGTASGVLFTPAGNISATNVQAALQELDNEKVAKAGDTMTGFLTLHANPDAPMKAATKQYVDTALGTAGVTIADTAPTPTQGKMWWESDTGVLWMSYTDASSTQWIGVGGTTAAISDASKADKTYVDSQDAAISAAVTAGDALRVLKAGDTMTGDLNTTILKVKTADGYGRVRIDCVHPGNSILELQEGGATVWEVGSVDHVTDGTRDLRILANTGNAAVFKRSDRSFNLFSTTPSTSPTTGALIVTGGVGIGGNVFANGGAEFGESVRIGYVASQAGLLFINGADVAGGGPAIVLSKTTGNKFAIGLESTILGAGTSNDFVIHSYTFGTSLFRVSHTVGNTSILSAIASTSPTTGALTVAGGVGIGGDLRIGGQQISSGNIVISKSGPELILYKLDGQSAVLRGQAGGSNRWAVVLGENNPDQSYMVYRFSDAGTPNVAMSIDRATGNVSINSVTSTTSTTTGALVVTGGIGVGGHITMGNNRQIFGTLTGGTTAQFLGAGMDNVMYLGANGWNHIYTDNEIRNLQSGTTMAAQPGRIRLGFTQSNSVGIALRCFTTAEAWYQTFEASTGVLAGNIVGSGSGLGVVYATASDTRGKANRERLSLEDARGIVDKLEVYDFDKDGNAIRGIGLVAQQAHGVHKSLAMPGRTDADWWMTEKAAPMPFVIANVQQLNKRLDALERRLRV